jgi:hypothetical protein
LVIFWLITGCDCLAAHLHRLSIFLSPICILCKKENSIMNHYHLPNCSSKFCECFIDCEITLGC